MTKKQFCEKYNLCETNFVNVCNSLKSMSEDLKSRPEGDYPVDRYRIWRRGPLLADPDPNKKYPYGELFMSITHDEYKWITETYG